MGWLSLLAGLLTSVGSFISNIWSNNKNQQNVNLNNATQIGLAGLSNQWSVEQWNRENAYNTPEMQRQRMLAGGFNPALMMSEGVQNLAGSSPAVSMPSTRPAQVMSPFSIDPLTAAQIRNIDMDTEQKRSQIDLNNSEVKVNEDSIEVGRIRLDFDKNLNDAQIGYLAKQCEDIDRHWELLQANIESVRKDIEVKEAQTGLLNAQETAQNLENLFNQETMQNRIDEAYERLEGAKLQNKLSRQQFEHLAKMYVLDENLATEELNQLIAQGKFDAKMRPYELLEQQNNSWVSGKELESVSFNLSNAKAKHNRHSDVGRYIDDVLGSLGQVLGGTASYSVPVNPRPQKVSGFRRLVK